MPEQHGGGGSGSYKDWLKKLQAFANKEGLNVSLAQIDNALRDAWNSGLRGDEALTTAAQSLVNSSGPRGGGGDGAPPVIGDTDGGTGGTSGGSSGSSGSSGGGSSGPDPAVLRSYYTETARAWGISPGDAGVSQLISSAINNEWTTTQFKEALRRTAAYKKAFPGLDWRNGQTEAQYLNEYRNYSRLTEMILGRNLSRQQFGTLMRKGSTIQDFQIKLQGLQTMNQRKDLFEWYERVLRQTGQIRPGEQVSKKEMFQIAIGQPSRRFENVYQQAWVGSNLERIGITIGKKGDMTRAEINKLIRQYESGTPGAEVEKIGAQDWAELATQVQEVVPLSQLYGMGVSERDLVELKFGGRKAPEIAERVQTIMASFNLEQEENAQSQLIQESDTKSRLLSGGISGESGY